MRQQRQQGALSLVVFIVKTSQFQIRFAVFFQVFFFFFLFLFFFFFAPMQTFINSNLFQRDTFIRCRVRVTFHVFKLRCYVIVSARFRSTSVHCQNKKNKQTKQNRKKRKEKQRKENDRDPGWPVCDVDR